MKKCIIVADGPSAKDFVPPSNVPIIAVKGAIEWLSRADYWFSLDPNERTMQVINNPKEGVKYYCACPDNIVLPNHVIRLKRIAAHTLPRHLMRTMIQRWSCVLTLNEDPTCINTGNSAYGALGLAYHLGFRDVLLVGVDGTMQPRLSDKKRPNNLSHLPELFESTLHQVKLSSISRLGNKIPKVTLEEWLNDE